jgi:hypothetical protein
MTTLLKKAVSEATSLSEDEQDFLVSLVLENIQDTRQWDAQFTASKDVLEELFDEAMKEYREGYTTPINTWKIPNAAALRLA